MNERCEKHSITRCTTCMALERKKPQSFVPAAPSEITGAPAPPPDIEQMDADSLRAELNDSARPADEFPTGFPLHEVPSNSHGWVSANVNGKPYIRDGKIVDESLDTLPVDDSHASKVMRAASAYATASKDWAQNLARVEKIKSELLKAEALLYEAAVAKETSEQDLKTLVTGVA